MDKLKFFNVSGNHATYQETSAFIPGVVLGGALPGMSSIGRPSEGDVYTGFRVEKDADNYQIWLASFHSENVSVNEWFAHTPILTVGTLSYGDAVSVTAVPIAEMFSEMIDQMDDDASYPIIVTAGTYSLTKSHLNKLVVFQNACSVTIDTSYSTRPWCAHVVQGGTGQITLSADLYNGYNGGSTNTAYVITNSRYKRYTIMKTSVSEYMVVS